MFLQSLIFGFLKIFRNDGSFVSSFGNWGSEPGQMKGLEGICLLPDGDIVISDRENHRIQVFWFSAPPLWEPTVGCDVLPVQTPRTNGWIYTTVVFAPGLKLCEKSMQPDIETCGAEVTAPRIWRTRCNVHALRKKWILSVYPSWILFDHAYFTKIIFITFPTFAQKLIKIWWRSLYELSLPCKMHQFSISLRRDNFPKLWVPRPGPLA